MGRLETSLLVFDVETTGLQRDQDQIIELALQAGLGQDAPRHCWRFRPAVAIDPASQRIHGISAEELAAERSFADHAAELHRMFSRAHVLIGYNVGFDLDMLQAEFRRAGLDALDVSGKLVIDPYWLWRKMEPRGLQQAHLRFVGTAFDGAHRAQADVAATAAVLGGMLATFGLQAAEWPAVAALCASKKGGCR
jgi:DNA polymerase-3 subunit epsilon